MSVDTVTRLPRAAYAALGASIVGLAAAIYLTVEHFSSSLTLACPDTGAINCAKVTTSKWSHFAGIPVSVLGVVFFVGMSVLCLPVTWRVRQLDVLRVLGAVLGVVGVIYLVWAELFELKAICLYCTVVHVCTLIVFGAVLWTVNERSSS
ncbi:MAG TPA: vitamin K epoxide reductase family protein [Jatrophihabitans sp.]|jgi:uncharacterized membrane protein